MKLDSHTIAPKYNRLLMNLKYEFVRVWIRSKRELSVRVNMKK